MLIASLIRKLARRNDRRAETKKTRNRRPWRLQFQPLTLELLETRCLLSASNSDFVSRIYHDLLERPVDTAGTALWGSMLDQGGSREQVVLAIEASPEYRTK